MPIVVRPPKVVASAPASNRGGVSAGSSKLVAPPGHKKVSRITTTQLGGGLTETLLTPEMSLAGLKGSDGEISKVLGAMAKTYSAASMRLATVPRREVRLATGIFSVDLALAGGFLHGQTNMAYGKRSSGKSTLLCRQIASYQRRFPDSLCIYIDVERTFDPVWAVKNGVDLDRLLIIEPECGEHALDQAQAFLYVREVGLIAVDSIAALTPTKEIEGASGDSLPGLQARLINQFLRKINSAQIAEAHRNHFVTLAYINQFRMKIGVMFGDPRTLPGGEGLEYYTSQQLSLTNSENKPDSGEFKGIVRYNEHEFRVTKDKTGGMLKEGKFKLIRDPEQTGLPIGYIDQMDQIVTAAGRVGLADRRGSMLDIVGHGSFKGGVACREYFDARPDALEEYQATIIGAYRKKWELPPLLA